MLRPDIALFRRVLILFDIAVCIVAFLVTLYLRRWLAIEPQVLPEMLAPLDLPAVYDVDS